MLRSRLNQAPCSVLHRGRMKGCWRAKALKQSEKAWIKDTRVSFTLYLEPFVALTYPSLHVSQHRPSPCLHLSCSSRPYSLAGYFNEHNLTKIKYSRGYQEELNENVNSKSSHDTFCMLWKEMLKCLRTVQPQPQKKLFCLTLPGCVEFESSPCGFISFLRMSWVPSTVRKHVAEANYRL